MYVLHVVHSMLCIACCALRVYMCMRIVYIVFYVTSTQYAYRCTDYHYRCVSPFGHTKSYVCSIECGGRGGASVEEKLSPSQVRLNADDVVLASPRNQTQAIQVKDFLLKTNINCIYTYHTNMQWYSRIRNLNGPP